MIFSGLDWSGSPGPAHGPTIVFAIVHVADADLPSLESELTAAAERLGWPPHFVFKHSGAKSPVHREFYQALHRIPFQAHVHILDKASWHAQCTHNTEGKEYAVTTASAMAWQRSYCVALTE